MKKVIIYFSISLAITLLTRCKPSEDRTDISGISSTTLKYTEVQSTENNNHLIINFNNTNAVPFYEICRASDKALLTTGNLRVDTFDLPFQGTYLVRVFGYFNSGIATDSFQVTTTQPDPSCFSNPDWIGMSNSAAGKAWTMATKYVGPENDYHTNWWAPGGFANMDTIYFDLNFGYNYKRSLGGNVVTTTWSLTTDTFPLLLPFFQMVPLSISGMMMPVRCYLTMLRNLEFIAVLKIH